jgi:hypothetical protein
VGAAARGSAARARRWLALRGAQELWLALVEGVAVATALTQPSAWLDRQDSTLVGGLGGLACALLAMQLLSIWVVDTRIAHGALRASTRGGEGGERRSSMRMSVRTSADVSGLVDGEGAGLAHIYSPPVGPLTPNRAESEARPQAWGHSASGGSGGDGLLWGHARRGRESDLERGSATQPEQPSAWLELR